MRIRRNGHVCVSTCVLWLSDSCVMCLRVPFAAPEWHVDLQLFPSLLQSTLLASIIGESIVQGAVHIFSWINHLSAFFFLWASDGCFTTGLSRNASERPEERGEIGTRASNHNLCLFGCVFNSLAKRYGNKRKQFCVLGRDITMQPSFIRYNGQKFCTAHQSPWCCVYSVFQKVFQCVQMV